MARHVADELYGLDPNDFVAARNELARRLRKEGERARAAEVTTLRRPTPAAWAVNMLVRRHRAEVEELVRLGEGLREAQDEALAGGAPGDLRQAGRARRHAVGRLSDRAEELLAARGGTAGTHAAEVASTLEAASLDAAAASSVLEGRLTAALEPPSGFGASAAPDTVPRPAPKAREPVAQTGPTPAQVGEAEDAIVEAKRRWEECSAQARAAMERVTENGRTAQDAEAEVARLENLLDEGRDRLRAAVRDAELAQDAASRAEDAASRAAESLRKAGQRLADLHRLPQEADG